MDQSRANVPSESNSLRNLLRSRRAKARIEHAELIRDYPECPERTSEAEQFIRETMLEFTLAKIGEEERLKIFEILSFAVPQLPQNLANPEPTPWSAENP